jgi:aspartate aminotransferase-like enzyme
MAAKRSRPSIIVSPGPVHAFPGSRKEIRPLHHRSDDFRRIVRETEGMLRRLLGTSSPVYLLTSSGTGAMEAAIANVTVPGSRVLVVSGGKFGRRWAEISRAYECRTTLMETGMGKAVDVDSVAGRIGRDRPEYVAVTHVESSTGLLFPVGELAARLGPERPILIVDAISSAGAEDLDMDAWGIDVVVGASQKSLAAPAGASFIGVGRRASALVGRRGKGVYYFDLGRFETAREMGDTPFTPAIETIQVMHRSLGRMSEAGFGSVISRHREASAAFLAAAELLSFRSLPESPSSAVQVLETPPGCRAGEILERLARHGFVAADGQDELKGKVIRTGFLGLYDLSTLERLVSALGTAVADGGCSVDVRAARERMREYGHCAPLFGDGDG